MQAKLHCLVSKLFREDSGQTIVVFSLMLVLMLAMAGFVIDIGRAMVVNNQLKSGTIAAALAGANEMPNSDYVTVAKDYSNCGAPPTGSNITTGCTTNENNYNGNLGMVTTNATGYCSSFVTKNFNITCTSMGSTSVNALVVTQTVTMPTTFMRLVGIPSLSFTTTETAAWKGAARNPYNVAVILDATGSMNTVDSGNDGCNSMPAFACALQGVQDFLQNLTPCSGHGACGSGTSPLDEVALYAFPGLSSTQAVSDDVNCTAQIEPANVDYTTTGGYGATDATVYYGFPGNSFSGNAFLPSPGPIYQLVGYTNDYRGSDASTTLASTSSLVTAIGGGGESTCKYISSGTYYKEYGGSSATPWAGIQAAGGADTYYAGVLYQAQSDLYTQYTQRLTDDATQTSNVIVLLSDGDIQNGTSGDATPLGGQVTTPVYGNGPCLVYYTSGRNKGKCETYSQVQTGTTTSVVANGNSNGTYPSYDDGCQQAVAAAQAATNGTWPTSESSTNPVKTTVYTVAFGSENTKCSGESLSPCDTMREMASSYLTNSSQPDQDFYSDYLDNANGSTDTSCTSNNDVTNIDDIFTAIADTLTASKIIQSPAGCSAANTADCD